MTGVYAAEGGRGGGPVSNVVRNLAPPRPTSLSPVARSSSRTKRSEVRELELFWFPPLFRPQHWRREES